jgi:hypothetical protein
LRKETVCGSCPVVSLIFFNTEIRVSEYAAMGATLPFRLHA